MSLLISYALTSFNLKSSYSILTPHFLGLTCEYTFAYTERNVVILTILEELEEERLRRKGPRWGRLRRKVEARNVKGEIMLFKKVR